MFRREWRQQLLVLALIVVALAATVLGAAVATNNPPPAGAGFGTAQDQAVFNDSGSRLASQLAALQPYGPLDVIENQTIAIPGSINTYDLRAQNPHGPFGLPMLSLLSGHYPAGPGQVAVTDGVAATFNLRVGDVWHQGGQTRLVTGLVQNPQSLLDEFALVAPGQVTAPSQVTVLLDARGASVSSLPASVRPYVQSRQAATSSNPLNPETIVLALATIGMLLIALVAVGGFTVLAQRRLRSLGMLGALGAADANIRLVVRINGVLVGLTGALVGAVLGLIGWLAYRPHLESTSHHVIGTFALPWVVIGPSIALAVLATYFAASRPARSITRVPLVAALSGRPAPPKQVHRSAIPGVVLLVVAGALFVYTGKSNGNGGSGALTLVGGFVVLIAAVIMLAPLVLTVLGLSARRAPIAVRLALRDLVRYRARSGSALAAISLGVLIAALICVLVAQRYGNVLDYTGPNLASNQIIVYTPNDNPNGGPHGGGPNGPSTPPVTSTPQSQAATASSIAKALGSDTVIALDQTGASLQHAAAGRSWSGPIYVATPQLLQAFGIKASDVSPDADFLTARPGLSGISKMQLIYGSYLALQGAQGGNGPGAQSSYPCPKTDCLAHPVIQEVGALPSGTSAPNTVITEHAIHLLGLQASLSGWLIQAPHPPTAAQITDARLTAAAAGMTIETKSSTPSSAEILDWATVFGIALALGILAMSVGLIRSETARDLRTLTATGASSSSRRILTATTAFALALGGAVLGTVAAYVAAIGYAFDNSLDGLSELSNVPTTNLLIILVGMPTIAGAVGLLVAGREPPALSHQPDEPGGRPPGTPRSRGGYPPPRTPLAGAGALRSSISAAPRTTHRSGSSTSTAPTPAVFSIRLARPGSSEPPPDSLTLPRTTSSARPAGISDSISCTAAAIAATIGSSADATRAPGTNSDRGERCATSRPTTSAPPDAPPVTPSVIFSCRAARWLMIRPSEFLTACSIASSMALPALRSERDRTTRQPATAATSVVPPPMSTTKPPAPPDRSNPAPAAAATGSSISRTLYRGRRTLSAAMIDRRSTWVAPLGTQTRAFGRSRPRRLTRRKNACSMAAAASRSEMTPSRIGWMTWMSCGSLSASASASSPTAATLPAAVSMAIAVGSSSTMPRPATQTSVFTVPRSMATLLRRRMLVSFVLRSSAFRSRAEG
jgi:putative ABC transport system permease protein